MKQNVKRAVTAFVELVFTSILRTCFQVAVFGCDDLGEFLSMILVNFLIGMLVQITLALLKIGGKIMCNKFRRALDNGQKPKINNKTRDQSKVNIAWVN